MEYLINKIKFDCQKQERIETIEDQNMKWGDREMEEYGEMVYTKKQNNEVLFEYNLK